ncbi:14 kDa phosphohistidine phosphatase isoform X2 [Nilaparvata lugens]|nr:14 kDa phosphohistidine phosphatase isoform X2 [Nilaparvata lugens]
MADLLSQVADVDIDANGTFKYILIRVYGPDTTDNSDPPSKLIVRGYQRASYHVDIYEEVQAKQLKQLGLECECEGGGRIKHDRDEKRLLVYGYSQGFGRANHQLAVDLLKVNFPGYEVTWTNDGY